MLTFVKQTKIVEIIDSKRAYRNFLHVIEKTTFIFVEIYEFQIKVVMNYKTQFIVIIDIFRHHMRMKKIRKKKAIFNSTFVVDENEKSNNRSSFFRNQQ